MDSWVELLKRHGGAGVGRSPKGQGELTLGTAGLRVCSRVAWRGRGGGCQAAWGQAPRTNVGNVNTVFLSNGSVTSSSGRLITQNEV